MEFMDIVKNRYSCKKFDGRKVEAEKLAVILEAGRLAPTAKNLQEQHIYVVQSEELFEKLDKETPCRYNAGTVLVVAFDKNNVFTYPGEKRDSQSRHHGSGAGGRRRPCIPNGRRSSSGRTGLWYKQHSQSG